MIIVVFLTIAWLKYLPPRPVAIRDVEDLIVTYGLTRNVLPVNGIYGTERSVTLSQVT